MSALPEVEGVTHHWVRVRGVELHYAEAGSGDDVVLCLHGWPQHWYEWRRLMPALAADGYRVIAPDLRGFGWSEAPADGYEKENLADDVLALLDELGLERVKLVGHDWGAGSASSSACGSRCASSATSRSTSCRPGRACGRWRRTCGGSGTSG